MSESEPIKEPKRPMSREEFAGVVDGISGAQIIDGVGNHAAVQIGSGNRSVIIDWGFFPKDLLEAEGSSE